MRKRTQQGSIITIGSNYYVRYWERVNVNGNIERKRRTREIGPIPKGYRCQTPPDDIVKAAEQIMRDINDSPVTPAHCVSVPAFMEDYFLPWVQQNRRPSTWKGCKIAWQQHLKPASKGYRGSLRDVRCEHVQQWLDEVNRLSKGKLAKNTLLRIKATVSAGFSEAKRVGYYDGSNPVADTLVSPHAAPAAQTRVYNLEEIDRILAVLPEPVATVFAVAAFTGLRRGEIEGLEWGDLHDGKLYVNRGVWNGKVLLPKTAASCAPVKVIKQLADRLEFHRLRAGEPQQTDPIFKNEAGHRANLNNMLNRAILPALNVCVHCGKSEGLAHLSQDHQYLRDDRIPEWKGFHACRRGLGSNLYRLGVLPDSIKKILRHSNVSTTSTYYIKSTSADADSGMEKLSQEITAQNLRDSDRTVNLDSGAMPKSVN